LLGRVTALYKFFGGKKIMTKDEAIKKGKEALKQEDWDSAIAAFTLAIESAKDADEAYNGRGYAHCFNVNRDDDYSKAIEDFSVSLTIKEDAKVRYRRAYAYRLNGQYDRAQKDCEQARTDPAVAAFANGLLGDVYSDLREYQKAKDSYKSAMEPYPDLCSSELLDKYREACKKAAFSH
jgi:tetratricopeptide (TPR) repeat protein